MVFLQARAQNLEILKCLLRDLAAEPTSPVWLELTWATWIPLHCCKYAEFKERLLARPNTSLEESHSFLEVINPVSNTIQIALPGSKQVRLGFLALLSISPQSHLLQRSLPCKSSQRLFYEDQVSWQIYQMITGSAAPQLNSPLRNNTAGSLLTMDIDCTWSKHGWAGFTSLTSEKSWPWKPHTRDNAPKLLNLSRPEVTLFHSTKLLY